MDADKTASVLTYHMTCSHFQTIFNDYLESKKATLFIDTAHIVERYLEEAAEAARVALYKALEKIAKEVSSPYSDLCASTDLAVAGRSRNIHPLGGLSGER